MEQKLECRCQSLCSCSMATKSVLCFIFCPSA